MQQRRLLLNPNTILRTAPVWSSTGWGADSIVDSTDEI